MEMPDIQLLYSVNAEDSVNVPDDMKEAERVIGQNENVTFMQSYRGFNRSFVISLDEDEIEESFLEAGMRSGYISAMEPGGIRMYVTLCALRMIFSSRLLKALMQRAMTGFLFCIRHR